MDFWRICDQEGETIRINVKNKSSSGAGMLSSATGISAMAKTKSVIAPPPSGTGKTRSPLPPPPNDPASARMVQAGVKASKPTLKNHTLDTLSDLSSIEVCSLLLNLDSHELYILNIV